MKGGTDRGWLEDGKGAFDDWKLEQILLCSIAEGCCLHCSEEPTHMALYPAIARFNHSCSPNACVSGTRSAALVRAITSIPAGSEVTISYLPNGALEDPTQRH